MSDLNPIPRNSEGESALKRSRINETQNDSASASAAAPRVSAGKMEDDPVMHDQSIVERRIDNAIAATVNLTNIEGMFQDYVSRVGEVSQSIKVLLFCYHELVERQEASAEIRLSLANIPLDLIKHIALCLVPEYAAIYLSYNLPIDKLEVALEAFGVNMRGEYAAINKMSLNCLAIEKDQWGFRTVEKYLHDCHTMMTGYPWTADTLVSDVNLAAFQRIYGRKPSKQFVQLLREFSLLPSQILADEKISKDFITYHAMKNNGAINKKSKTFFLNSLSMRIISRCKDDEGVITKAKLSQLGMRKVKRHSSHWMLLDEPLSLQRLENFPNLSNLAIYNSNLYPNFAWRPVNLTRLTLFDCQLNELPRPFFQAKGLVFLDIKANNFTELSPRFKKFNQLKELDIAYNPLSDFPAVLLELPHLRKLFCEATPNMDMSPTCKVLNGGDNPFPSLNWIYLLAEAEFEISSKDYHIREDNKKDIVAVAAHKLGAHLIAEIHPIFWDAAVRSIESKIFINAVVDFDDVDNMQPFREAFVRIIKNMIALRRSDSQYVFVPPPCYSKVVKS